VVILPLAILLSIALAGCRRFSTTGAEVADILLITVDTARADKFSYAGASSVPTPNIDSLAAEGTAFLQAVSPAPITLVAHASLFTGRLPIDHGVRNNGTYRLGPDAVTLAELLRERGYRTAAFVGAAVLDSRYGLDQGFDHYDDDVYEDKHQPERRGEIVVARALDWLQQAGGERTFVWVHLFDPHSPYEPPEPERARHPNVPYDGEIAYVDRVVGDLLQGYRELGRFDRALIVFTSDHGESLGEHGEESHGVFVYDATVRVPLVIRAPGVGSGRRVEAQVQLVDVLPTVAELARVPAPERLRVRSLVPLVRGRKAASPPAYLESLFPEENFGWSRLEGVRADGWKLVTGVEPELYDLESDAGETHDLAAEEPERLAELTALLSSDFAEGNRTAAQAVELDEAARRELEALGYLGAGGRGGRLAAQEPAGRKPDPRRRIHLNRVRSTAAELFDRGFHDAAIERLEGILREDPANPWVRDQLLRMLVASGRRGRAESLVEAILEDDEPDPRAWRYRGILLELSGRDREAAEAYDVAARADPQGEDLRWRRWDLLLSLGELDLVAKESRAGGRADSGDLDAVVAAARSEGDPERQVDELRHALASSPDEPAILFGLGDALFSLARFEEALPLQRRAQFLEMSDERYAIGLARTLAALGRWADVHHVLRNLRSRAMLRPEAWLLLAQACLEREDLPCAIMARRRVSGLTGEHLGDWLAALERRLPKRGIPISFHWRDDWQSLADLPDRLTATRGPHTEKASTSRQHAETLLTAGKAAEARALLEGLYRRDPLDLATTSGFARACAASDDRAALREVLTLQAELLQNAGDGLGLFAQGDDLVTRLRAAQTLRFLGTERWQAGDYWNALHAYLLGEILVPDDPRSEPRWRPSIGPSLSNRGSPAPANTAGPWPSGYGSTPPHEG
jgi:arylsulfatase A-like enzyme/predicted Zn-dependent protease